MCDILVATPEVTENNVMLFGKNSDRDPNESQILEYFPRRENEEEKIELTYVSFPQVKETNAVMLSRPWWMWGAEMGANEHGLVIGNTAIFTNQEYRKSELLGMDIIRLALERTEDAKKALDFMSKIITKHGQGGNGSYEHDFFYHNSFIIADPEEAWVLETAGKNWAAKKISGIHTISNNLNINNDWSKSNFPSISEDEKNLENVNFSEKFSGNFPSSDYFKTKFSKAEDRQKFTSQKLKENRDKINLRLFMKILSSHQTESFTPEKGSNRDVCMHYGGFFRQSQTASSQISKLDNEDHVHWFTGTSNPCLSIFKPIHFGEGPPNIERKGKNRFNPDSYWWKFEKLHRKIQTKYEEVIEKFSDELEKIQEKIIEKERNSKNKFENTEWAFEKEEEMREKWEEKLELGSLPFSYGINWKLINEKAGLKLPISFSIFS